MYIYQKYILRRLIIVFVASVVIVTGLLFVGNILKMIEKIAFGIKAMSFFKMMLYMVPNLLSYALPMSILTACLLVFGKLSAENELIALRTSGISLMKIVLPVVLFALFIGCFSMVQLGVIKPAAYSARRNFSKQIKKNPTALFIPGQEVKLAGYLLFIEKREGNILYNVMIKQASEQQEKALFYKGEWGEIKVFPKRDTMRLELHNYTGRLAMGEGTAEDKGDQIDFTFDLGLRSKPRLKTYKPEMSMKELIIHRSLIENNEEQRLKYTLQINKRITFSLACIAFAAIGIPLGISVHRGEKAIGFAVSLPLFLAYYVADSMIHELQKKPHLHPEILQWLPNIILIALGIWLFRRIYRGT
jgi:lipopolysaccharide export LptBFGC system permease protein LptF